MSKADEQVTIPLKLWEEVMDLLEALAFGFHPLDTVNSLRDQIAALED